MVPGKQHSFLCLFSLPFKFSLHSGSLAFIFPGSHFSVSVFPRIVSSIQFDMNVKMELCFVGSGLFLMYFSSFSVIFSLVQTLNKAQKLSGSEEPHLLTDVQCCFYCMQTWNYDTQISVFKKVKEMDDQPQTVDF